MLEHRYATRPDPDAVPPPPPTSLWHNRDFLLLWAGQAVSASGSSVAAIVYPLLALAATGSAARAGAVAAIGVSVALLLQLPAGALADRYPLRPIMVAADVARALVTASIVVAIVVGTVTWTQLVIAAVVSAAAGALFTSAQAVAVRHIVPSEQLPRALAQNEARGHIASLTGQPLGGLLYAVSAATPVLADALSYAVSGALIARIRGAMSPHGAGRPTGSLWRDIPVGLRHLWASRFLRTTMICTAGINMVFAGLSLVIIAAQSAHGTAPVHIGVIFSMGAVGGIMGAIASGPMQRWASPPALIYIFGWTATAGLLTMSESHSVYVTGALLAVIYFAVAPASAMLFAVQIHVTPAELQGRVISAAMLIGGAAVPMGPVVGGFVFDDFGQMVIFIVFAAMMAVLTATMHLSPAIRTMRRPGEN